MYSTITIKSNTCTCNNVHCSINISIINKKSIISLKTPIKLGMICYIRCEKNLTSRILEMLKEEYPDANIEVE